MVKEQHDPCMRTRGWEIKEELGVGSVWRSLTLDKIGNSHFFDLPVRLVRRYTHPSKS